MPVTHSMNARLRRRGQLDAALRWILTLSSLGVAGYALFRYFGFPPATGVLDHLEIRVTAPQPATSAKGVRWRSTTGIGPRLRHETWGTQARCSA